MTIAQTLTEYIEPILEIIILLLNVISVLILLWGMITAVRHYLTNTISKKNSQSKIQLLTRVKVEIGSYILFSLELLIITDIIESTMQPTIEGLIRLALIVVIRTTLSFFLQKEIQAEQAEQIAHELLEATKEKK